MKFSKLMVMAMLVAGFATGASANQRVATIGVSATVLASCRVDAASQVASATLVASATNAVLRNSQCSGTTRPATQAVVETSRPQLVKVAMQASDAAGPGAPWVRLDVIY